MHLRTILPTLNEVVAVFVPSVNVSVWIPSGDVGTLNLQENVPSLLVLQVPRGWTGPELPKEARVTT